VPADMAFLGRVDAYIERLFVPPDPVLAAALARASAAGLPAIQVSATQGRLISLLAAIAGARRVLEIGTLGGYSTTWLARAVGAGGRVVTLELVEAHAAVARETVAAGAPGVDVDVRVGPAADTLRGMAVAGEPPFDLVFIDADKPGYPAYLELVMPLTRPGTVILADNVIRDGTVMADPPPDANAAGARAFNAAFAAHPRIEAVIVPTLRETVDGMAIGRVVE
jgi:predicted O-methyltransferase YrrM